MMADRDRTVRLLKTARGQIDGILRMVEDDRYCIDISTQLMATESLIARINADVLKAHIEGCVRTAADAGTPGTKYRIAAVAAKLWKEGAKLRCIWRNGKPRNDRDNGGKSIPECEYRRRQSRGYE